MNKWNGEDNIKELEKILEDPKVTEDVKRIVQTMNKDGMQLLNDYYDENSNFYQRAQPELIANKFYADPSKIKNLYHYTTYEAFEKILSSSTFLIVSIHYMNDDKEVKYVYELMKKELQLLEAPNDIILKLEELNTILPNDVYVWSFSENDYSQALSNYGDIALGFDSQEIMEHLASYYSKGKKTLDEYTVGNAYVFPLRVEYSHEVQSEYIRTLAQAWLIAHDNLKYDPYDMGVIIDDIVQALHFFSLLFKNPYLRQEEEIRYIIFNINEDNLLKPEMYMNSKPFTTCRFTYEMLKEVIINPKSQKKIRRSKHNA
ncbi:hypothetical protein [Staphylococcus ureilyticus]|uniref:Uncharacterized protein n=1 Tax=Staphylococcus ureilyticus TaxID=94138 RepID=A0AB34ANJ1_STAUR|nr:hypothetical protein [Staphylococcus ureilyticus]GEQ03427.1 hypothetical protein SCO02_18680 [Staphylococcus ureilyticus]